MSSIALKKNEDPYSEINLLSSKLDIDVFLRFGLLTIFCSTLGHPKLIHFFASHIPGDSARARADFLKNRIIE